MMKYFLLVAVLVLAACSNDDDVDTTKPEIEVIKPVAEEGEEHIHLHQGDTFDFEAKFTDNVALKSYKVAIHYNGDDHEHSAVVKSTDEDEHVEWEDDFDGDIEGTEDIAVISAIEVPDNAEPGEYHLGVYCFDEAGNESTVWLELEVEESHE